MLGKNAKQLVDALEITLQEAERIEKLLARGIDTAFALEELSKRAIFVTTRSEQNYPSRLKKILQSKYSPPVVFYCGDPALANSEGIAVVGSRRIDEQGEQYTRCLVEKAVEQHMTIYSGGAKGVDSIAISAGLNSGGNAVAFMADSMQRFSSNIENREAIADGKLLLLSAVMPTASFSVGNAMARNKYIYSLARATMVIASDHGKGGTWSGAVESLKHGWGCVFVQQTDAYAGNLPLLREGAAPIPPLDDISFDELIASERVSLGQRTLFN